MVMKMLIEVYVVNEKNRLNNNMIATQQTTGTDKGSDNPSRILCKKVFVLPKSTDSRLHNRLFLL